MVAVHNLNQYGREPSFPQPLRIIPNDQLRMDASGHEPNVFRHQLRRQIDRCKELGNVPIGPRAYRADAVDTLLASRDVEQVLADATRDVTGPRYSTQYLRIGAFGINPWAERFIHKRITRHGLLDYVVSADMPWIQVAMQEIARPINTIGARFGWSFFELQAAQFANQPLRPELAFAFNEAAEDTKDTIFLRGDSLLPKGTGLIPTGLINDPNITVAALGTGAWAGGATTADQMIADVRALVTLFRNQTRRRRQPSRWLMSETYFGVLEGTHIANTNVSVLSYLLANIEGLGRPQVLPGLETASASGGQRQIMFSDTESTIRGILPLDSSFIADETFQLRTDVYGVVRIVGVEIREPWAMLYADG